MQLQAKKSLGQNFLHDEGILRRIAASANINSGDIVIEIGSGLGALTKQLLTTELSKLIAFEVDDRAIEILQREFSDTRFELRHQDFLEADLSTISSDKIRVTGNIPYYITSPIIFKLIDNRKYVKDALLLVQLEVAERLTAKPQTKEYGIPTILTNFFGEVTYLFKVKAGSFRPAPKVDSAVIRIDFEKDYYSRNNIEQPSGLNTEAFRGFVRQVFAMRRKMLRNNLKPLMSQERMSEMASHTTLSRYLTQRPEELEIPDLLDIYQFTATQ